MIMKYMNPAGLLSKAKKKHDMLSSVLVLFSASIIFGVASALGLSKSTLLPSALSSGVATVAVSVFGMVFAGGLLLGWVLEMVATIIGAKGDFFAGLTSVAYSMLYLSIGFVLSSVFGLLSNPLVTMLASFVAVMLFGAIGFATMFRAVKEFFDTDVLTTFIIITIVGSVVFMSLYVLALTGAASSGSLFTGATIS
jgi:predicted Abi (CAAX) family protease